MRLTEEDKAMFEALKGNKALKGYLERLESVIFDSRNWDEGMTSETAKLAAKPIQILRSHLKSSTLKEVEKNEYL